MAEDFRAQIRLGMALFGASATDVARPLIGAPAHDAKWVWLQLAPSRELQEHNARDLFWMLANCQKAASFRRKNNAGALDEWTLQMLRQQPDKFYFLAHPIGGDPPPMMFSPESKGQIADALASHLEAFGPKSKIRDAILRWLTQNGGHAGWLFAYRAWIEIQSMNMAFSIDGEPLDVDKLQATLRATNHLLWKDDEQYKTFLDSLGKEEPMK